MQSLSEKGGNVSDILIVNTNILLFLIDQNIIDNACFICFNILDFEAGAPQIEDNQHYLHLYFPPPVLQGV